MSLQRFIINLPTGDLEFMIGVVVHLWQNARRVFILAIVLIFYVLLATPFSYHQLAIFQEQPLYQQKIASSRYVSPPKTLPENIDWSQVAYAQYATDETHLCNSLMFFERLSRFGSKADRILLYPTEMFPDPLALETDHPQEDAGRLLMRARDHFGVRLIPINLIAAPAGNARSYSLLKLLIFDQTRYNRVVAVDADSTLMRNIDELFLIDPGRAAMPLAYWHTGKQHLFSPRLIVAHPSFDTSKAIRHAISALGQDASDTEILNRAYGDTAKVIPRHYSLLSSEFRTSDHSQYLGSKDGKWDAVKIFDDARIVYFSDPEVPKPWFNITEQEMEEYQPECQPGDCTARQIWRELYADFRARREVCSCKTGMQAADQRS